MFGPCVTLESVSGNHWEGNEWLTLPVKTVRDEPFRQVLSVTHQRQWRSGPTQVLAPPTTAEHLLVPSLSGQRKACAFALPSVLSILIYNAH